MPQLPDEVLYDVRLLERHVRRGVLTRQEVEQRLQKLEDRAEDGEALDLEQLAQQAASERARPTPKAAR